MIVTLSERNNQEDIHVIEQSRRGFLGSTLGIFVGTQLPWIARLPTDELILQPEYVLEDFRTVLRLGDGRTIQGPGAIEIKNDTLYLADINCVLAMRVDRVGFFYKGKFDMWRHFTRGPLELWTGDTLRINASLPHLWSPS